MAELKRCPECGGVATVIHMYDTYDRADFGWAAGLLVVLPDPLKEDKQWKD